MSNKIIKTKKSQAMSELGKIAKSQTEFNFIPEYLKEMSPRVVVGTNTKRVPSIGDSKIGGYPDLPEGILWPTWNRKKLQFLAQLNMSDVSKTVVGKNFPDRGTLLFFYDNCSWGEKKKDSNKAWRILYNDAPKKDLIRRVGVVGVRIYLERAVNLRDYWEPSCRIFESKEECNEFVAHLRRLAYFHEYKRVVLKSDYNCANFIGGKPSMMNTTEDYYDNGLCENYLLLQIGSDENTEMNWVDGGYLHFYVSPDDFESLRFDRSFFRLDST